MSDKWKETYLWKALENRGKQGGLAKELATLLETQGVMPKINLILMTGATQPKDFTLHDADHSYRVAQRMWEIIPGNANDPDKEFLSELDLAFMLLSAYLHDIGMTPAYQKINKHLDLLLFRKNRSLFTNPEIKEFQEWLDDEGENVDLDTPKDSANNDELRAAIRLVTYYARHKHNDWSEEWIRVNLKELEICGSKTWLTYLVNICKSHHSGLSELKDNKYNPVPLGTSRLHRRYVAMCLRVSDVMEIDPERTPDVILKHRDIAPDSIIYWIKDAGMTMTINSAPSPQKTNKKVSITSSPETAYIHRAVLDTCLQIENELRLCYDLKNALSLNESSTLINLNYEWVIEPAITKVVEPNENKYEFIEGTFRPNTEKILELLGGTELYGNPLLAIRELLQNSFDAIKESIAYYQLAHPNLDEDKIALLREAYSVVLTLVEKKIEVKDNTGQIVRTEKEIWLKCEDNGVGMNKEIIQKYFLVSGASQRRQITDLARKCKRAKVNFERTGKFGIGVLSYFMIADVVKIYTKREQDTGYADISDGWSFEINGLQDFGELKKEYKNQIGSVIELRLLKSINDDYQKCYLDIKNLLDEQLIKIPCKFELKNASNDSITVISPGWCKTESHYNNIIKHDFEEVCLGSDFDHTAEHLHTRSEMNNRSKASSEVENHQLLISEKLRFVYHTFKIADDSVECRIALPYFEHLNGKSLLYFTEDGIRSPDGIIPIKAYKIDSFLYAFLKGYEYSIYGYKGFKFSLPNAVERNSPFPHLVIGEINILSNAEINIEISRNQTTEKSTDFLESLYNEIYDRSMEMIISEVQNWSSKYGVLDAAVIGENIGYHLNLNDEFKDKWYRLDYSQTKLIQFDLISPWAKFDSYKVSKFKNCDIMFVPPIMINQNRHFPGPQDQKAKYVTLYRNQQEKKIGLLLLYENSNFSYASIYPATFPDGWENIVGYCFVNSYGYNSVISSFQLNETSLIASYLTSENLLENEKYFSDPEKVTQFESDFSGKLDKQISLMLHLLINYEARVYAFLLDTHGSFVMNAMKHVLQMFNVSQFTLIRRTTFGEIESISVTENGFAGRDILPAGWRAESTSSVILKESDFFKLIPKPSDDWIIDIQD